MPSDNRIDEDIGPGAGAPAVAVPTARLSGDLRGRVASGTAISLSSQALQFIIMFGSTVVLARLLPPEDFGKVAMAMTVLGYFRIFKDAGLSVATIQREDITHAQVSNLFWINVGLSAGASLLFAACAPLIAWFFRERELTTVATALATTFLLSGLAVQHMALLSREMRFSSVAIVQIVSTTAGTATGIIMALLGFGYWSLVAMQLATPAVALVMAWLTCPWRPQRPRLNVGTWPLVQFGANLTATGVIHSVARGLDMVLIGRIYGAASVGLYSRAAALLIRPLDNFLAPMHSVLVPVLSRLQDDTERYRRVFLEVFEAIVLFCFVLSGLLMPLALPLTLVLLGPNWEAAAPILAGFALLGLAYPPCDACAWLFASQGRGGDFFRTTLCGAALTVLAFVAGLPYGAHGVAISFSVVSLFVILPVYIYFAGAKGPISRRDLFRGFVRHFPVWAVVCGTTYVTQFLVADRSPWLQLGICLPAGLIAAMAAVAAYPPARRTAQNLVATVQQMRRVGA